MEEAGGSNPPEPISVLATLTAEQRVPALVDRRDVDSLAHVEP
ncbi:hypothetical protein [Haloarcula rubra]|nr:hypothetical protein [Halomicroarcula rubra]